MAYHFTTREDFQRLVREDGFIEHAQFGSNLYGTSVQAVKDDMRLALPWIQCLINTQGDKDQCMDEADTLVVSLPTVMAVLILLAVSRPQPPVLTNSHRSV